MQQHLFQHFTTNRHHDFLQDVSITLIDETDPKNCTKRQNYWMETLKTLGSDGLNVEDAA